MKINFNGNYALAVDMIQESYRNFNGTPETVLIIQSTNPDIIDMDELSKTINDGMCRILVYDGDENTVIEEIKGYSRIVSLNRTLRGKDNYFYDIQLGK